MGKGTKDLARFLKSLAVVAALLVAIDFALGRVLDHSFLRLPVRDKIPSTMALRHHATSDVVLIGSSRCHHHYVTSMLRDSLEALWGEGLSIYNYGIDGVYVNSSLCAIESMLERYSPKLVLLDAGSHEFDMVYRKTVETASPLYWNDGMVMRYINEARRRNRAIMLSSLYRYRGAMPLRMAEVYVTAEEERLGYSPLDKVMDTTAEYDEGPTTEEFVADASVTESFRRVAALCAEKGVRLVVVDSPRYHPSDNSDYVKALCAECGVLFIDFYETVFFNGHPELFYEPAHLNDAGAMLFTEKLCEKLRSL